jgi:esterase/lipase
VKLELKSYNEAKINIDNMVKKKAWLNKPVEKKVENQIYSGLFDKISKEKEKINVQGEQVNQSFSSFDTLFGNLREIKKIMNDMKTSSGESDGDNP